MEIVLNQTETKRMLEVKSEIDMFNNRNDMFNNMGIKYGIDYCEEDIIFCYNSIIRDCTHSATTAIDDVAMFFAKKGFIVEKRYSGGFDIYISNRMKKMFGLCR